jgi:hypothetical protein
VPNRSTAVQPVRTPAKPAVIRSDKDALVIGRARENDVLLIGLCPTPTSELRRT